MIDCSVLMSETASAPPRPGGARRAEDVGDIGRQLHDHRHAGELLAPAGDHLDILRHLPDRRAHVALAHAVRAAEIQFDTVAARLLDEAEDVLPRRLLARHHQAHHHGAIGPVALHLLDLGEVDRQRAVGDQFDVVEAGHPLAVVANRPVTAGHVDDRRVLAQRLPHHAAPAGLERADDVVRLVGRRRGGEPERVGRADSREIRRQIGHDGRSPYPPISWRWIVRGGDLAVLHGGDGQILARRRSRRRRRRRAARSAARHRRRSARRRAPALRFPQAGPDRISARRLSAPCRPRARTFSPPRAVIGAGEFHTDGGAVAADDARRRCPMADAARH